MSGPAEHTPFLRQTPVIEPDAQKSARLNLMAHLLSTVPSTEVPVEPVELLARLTGGSG